MLLDDDELALEEADELLFDSALLELETELVSSLVDELLDEEDSFLEEELLFSELELMSFTELLLLVTEIRVAVVAEFFIFWFTACHTIGTMSTRTKSTIKLVVRILFPRVCLRFLTREKLPLSSRSSSN